MRWKVLLASILVLLVVGVTVTAQNQSSSAGAAPEQSQADLDRLIARGDYLTHDVAMCVVCHSPKDERGNVIKSKEFQGASIPLSSPFPKGARWASNAPALGSIVAGNEEAVFALLTTGIWPPLGEAPRMPMPPYRMQPEDARAVIAYLKTI